MNDLVYLLRVEEMNEELTTINQQINIKRCLPSLASVSLFSVSISKDLSMRSFRVSVIRGLIYWFFSIVPVVTSHLETACLNAVKSITLQLNLIRQDLVKQLPKEEISSQTFSTPSSSWSSLDCILLVARISLSLLPRSLQFPYIIKFIQQQRTLPSTPPRSTRLAHLVSSSSFSNSPLSVSSSTSAQYTSERKNCSWEAFTNSTPRDSGTCWFTAVFT